MKKRKKKRRQTKIHEGKQGELAEDPGAKLSCKQNQDGILNLRGKKDGKRAL